MQKLSLKKGFALLASGAALAMFACADVEPRRESVEVRDSAGIRIVTNDAPADTAWTVEMQPTVEIGGDESDTTQILFRVAGAVVLEDDGIVIAQGPAPMVRWFDATGEYRFGAGRPGGGPGEFGSGEGAWISSIWALGGDSVATWEHPARRMQVFDPGGEFVRAVVLDLPPDMPLRAYPQIVGRLDDGFIASLTPPLETGTVGEVTRDPITYMRYRADGGYARTLATVPGYTFFTQLIRAQDGHEMKAPGRPPFSSSPAAWASGERLIYGSADRYELAVYDTVGTLKTLIRKTVPRRPLSSEVIAVHKAEMMADAPSDPAVRREWEESINAAPFPDSIPAYRRIRVDRLGMLWVQEYNLPGAGSATWSIFDREGRWVSDTTIPIDWQVLDIGDDYVLVLVRDDLDIERVRRHALDRR